MFNEIVIIGRLAKRPSLKETSNGIKIATIVLDVERPYRNNLGIKDHDYISCICWKGLAQQIQDCCEIGSFLGVRGRLQSRTFETSEKSSLTTMEVKVEHLEFFDRYFVKK